MKDALILNERRSNWLLDPFNIYLIAQSTMDLSETLPPVNRSGGADKVEN